MKKIKIAARAVWQLLITSYQFGCVFLRALWDAKVNFPLFLVLLVLAQNTYYSFWRYSKKEYDAGRVSAYNVGYQEGIDKAIQLQNSYPETDTMLVYDKPNGNVIDTILIPVK